VSAVIKLSVMALPPFRGRYQPHLRLPPAGHGPSFDRASMARTSQGVVINHDAGVKECLLSRLSWGATGRGEERKQKPSADRRRGNSMSNRHRAALSTARRRHPETMGRSSSISSKLCLLYTGLNR